MKAFQKPEIKRQERGVKYQKVEKKFETLIAMMTLIYVMMMQEYASPCLSRSNVGDGAQWNSGQVKRFVMDYFIPSILLQQRIRRLSD